MGMCLFLFWSLAVWQGYVKDCTMHLQKKNYKRITGPWRIRDISKIGEKPFLVLTYRCKRYRVFEQDGNCLLIDPTPLDI